MEVNKKKMSKTLVAIGIVSAFSSVSFAVTPGLYFGGGGGLGVVSNPSVTTAKSNGGLGGKVAVGFNFNPILGIEAGYAMYPQTLFILTLPLQHELHNLINDQVKLKAFNLVGKLYVPMRNNNPWDVYGLLGMVYVWEKSKVTVPTFNLDVLSESQNAALLAGGGGISYQLNKHFRTGLETLITADKGENETHPGIPQTVLTTLNLYYTFG